MKSYIGVFCHLPCFIQSAFIAVLKEPGQSEAGHPLVLPGIQQLLVACVAMQDIYLGKCQVILLVFQGHSKVSIYYASRGGLADEGKNVRA